MTTSFAFVPFRHVTLLVAGFGVTATGQLMKSPHKRNGIKESISAFTAERRAEVEANPAVALTRLMTEATGRREAMGMMYAGVAPGALIL